MTKNLPKQIEIAKKILKNNSECKSLETGICRDCPFSNKESGISHQELFGLSKNFNTEITIYIEAKRKYIENWLKENDFSEISFYEDEEEIV